MGLPDLKEMDSLKTWSPWDTIYEAVHTKMGMLEFVTLLFIVGDSTFASWSTPIPTVTLDWVSPIQLIKKLLF